MDVRVYLLMIVSFVVGMVELIVGGTLILVADDLGVSVSTAGQLITIFSLVFAISAPILLALTAKIERKRLTLWSLVVFFIGNILAFLSPSFTVLMLARIVSAMSGALLIVLCVTMASNMVEEKHRARAIGTIYMGVSGSLVLGVPLGLVIGNQFGWRAPFLFIAVLTLFSMLGVFLFLTKIEPKPMIPLRQQFATLKSKKIFSAQLATLFFLTGHLTLYAYLTPFLTEIMGVSGNWISIFYFIFGIAAVFGGGIGGFISDKWGARQTVLTIIVLFSFVMFVLPHVTFSMPLFIAVMLLWSMLSWAVTPPLQSYIITSAPESSDIQQSLNNSALHFGIALGSITGGLVIKHASVASNASVGALFVVLSFMCALYSITCRTGKEGQKTSDGEYVYR